MFPMLVELFHLQGKDVFNMGFFIFMFLCIVVGVIVIVNWYDDIMTRDQGRKKDTDFLYTVTYACGGQWKEMLALGKDAATILKEDLNRKGIYEVYIRRF